MTSTGVKINVSLAYAKEIEKAMKKLKKGKTSSINGIVSFQNGNPVQTIPEGGLQSFFLFDLAVGCLGATVGTAGVKGLSVNLSSPVH